MVEKGSEDEEIDQRRMKHQLLQAFQRAEPQQVPDPTRQIVSHVKAEVYPAYIQLIIFFICLVYIIIKYLSFKEIKKMSYWERF